VKILTRTRRIYNNRPIEGGPGFKGWITTETGDPSIKRHMYLSKSEIFSLEKRKDIKKEDSYCSPPFFSSYHPHDSNLCFGHCKSHKDPMKSKRRRLAYKEEFLQLLKMEGWGGSWDWFNEIKSSSLHVPEIWEDLEEI
jgi:hypothetical protein